ncbi:MAG: hypothetical protein EWV85_18945 [Microcystis aeruginosa Ma_QC_C_20070703_M131]|uniref:Uncharacterized protein n=1 Tax=Microcystis aeruginosa Ma_QC_C_20070703_M131 TaxID=2486263 RepID=A0A551XB45_MICAE|nr:MAG: hypothetical protein EWV85_18945 [Microcystis aeruginosa Ma_QC_C_20070703_M131]
MVYLQILCNLILICAVFEPSKINYARGLISLTFINCLDPLGDHSRFWLALRGSPALMISGVQRSFHPGERHFQLLT